MSAMQIRIFAIPVLSGENGTEEMNHFLRANKIVDIRKELVCVDGSACWTFCVTYIQGNFQQNTQLRKGKVDYKEILDEEAFARFVNLRKLRKEVADAESVPAYAVFTDAELSEIAKLEVVSKSDLLKIPGIGKNKAEKYGKLFCRDVAEPTDEKDGLFD